MRIEQWGGLQFAFARTFGFAAGLKSALLTPMRFVAALIFTVVGAFAAPPPELAAALKSFRADAPPRWSFTQTSAAGGKSIVERCDAARPEFAWRHRAEAH